MNFNNSQPKSYTGDHHLHDETFAAPQFRPNRKLDDAPSNHNGSTPSTTPPKPQHNTLAALKSSDALAFNSAAEELFCVLVLELLDEGECLAPATVYQECAYELNISIATAKRYLTKHTARRAMFGIDARGFIFQK